MARRTYRLSDETFKVLSGNESAIDREMECDVSYISKIKNSSEPDRYPPFREIFRAACHTGCAPAEIWLNDLTAIYVRSRSIGIKPSELSAKLLEKIETDAKSLSALVDALKDGKLEEGECHEVLSKLAKNQETNASIKQLVCARLGELQENRK
jgi:hypothetical protein